MADMQDYPFKLWEFAQNVHVSTLGGTARNYNTWHRELEMKLNLLGCGACLDPAEECTSRTSATEEVATAQDGPAQTSDRRSAEELAFARERAIKDDRLALTVIKASCSPHARAHLAQAKTAKEAMNILKDKYDKQDSAGMFAASLKIERMRMEDTESVMAWSNRMQLAHADLEDYGGSTGEAFKIARLLARMTPRYMPAMHVISREETNLQRALSFDEVIHILKSEESLNGWHDGSNQLKGQNKRKRCHNCGESSHLARHCGSR